VSRYENAARILPPHLLTELQRYAAGKQLYVPRPARRRLRWGERSGAREAIDRRNQEIRRRHSQGASIEELMSSFHLGYDSIRKIIHPGRPGRNESSRSEG